MTIKKKNILLAVDVTKHAYVARSGNSWRQKGNYGHQRNITGQGNSVPLLQGRATTAPQEGTDARTPNHFPTCSPSRSSPTTWA